jgi:hypothetical protein
MYCRIGNCDSTISIIISPQSLTLLHAYYALSFAMSGRIEKHILRAAFDTPEDPYLPKEILWRQKEQVRLCLTPAQ